jgi:uncharacterized protein GlcG (DUF336 family)
MRVRRNAFAALVVCSLVAVAAHAQVPQYGNNITLEQARRAIAAAEAEANRNSWPVAIAVVDTAGMLVAFQRTDNTQTGSIAVAVDKASSSAMYRRPSKAFQDAVAGGGAGLRSLNLRGASTVDGGVPLTVGGKIVGAIGVSGVTADQDGQIARAGAEGLK